MNAVGRSKSLLVGLVATAAGFVAVGLSAPARAAEGPQVQMVDNEPDLTRWHFDPAQITVPAGTTVVWFNKGREDHSVKADDNSFDSGLKASGATFSRAFAKPGTYAYHCAPHPWMKGTVEVTAGPTVRTAAAENPATAPTTAATAAAPPVAPSTPASAPAAAPPPAANQPESATTAPAPAGEGSNDEQEGSEDESAAGSHGTSGDPLAGTLAIVLVPTLGALALGAKLRQSRS
jgi:plastocyanin